MSLFKVVQAIQSAGVGVVGLDLRRTVVVLRSVGETAVIRFQCVSQRIEKFGGSHEGKVKCHSVTSATVARVHIDDERAGPPSSCRCVMLRVTSLRIRLTILEAYNYFPLSIHIELSPHSHRTYTPTELSLVEI